MPSTTDFLIERMVNAGLKHVFGVTGEYISKFFSKLSKSSSISLVTTSDQIGAGYAADTYARLSGIGCVAATYNVGALKLVNVVAGAFAERSPLIIISGSPPTAERGLDVQRDMFKHITCANTILSDPTRAGFEIDRVFEALKHYRQPIYIEIPDDISERSVVYDVYKQGTPASPKTDIENLDEAFDETIAWIESSKRPVLLAGVEIARFGLGSKLIKFAERSNIPFATTLLSKSVVPEKHPLYLGIYQGDSGQANARECIEESDCLIMLGVMSGDLTHRYMPADIKKRNSVSCTVEGLSIKNHAYRHIGFMDFSERLLKHEINKKPTQFYSQIRKDNSSFLPKLNTPVSISRFFEKLNSVLDDKMTILADGGVSLNGASSLLVHTTGGFIGSALYRSMGCAIPGALGAYLARPKCRPVVIVGDGGFQMSVSEFGTLVQNKVAPIVFVLDNGGHATEEARNEGSFNSIPKWDYNRITDLVGSGIGFKVTDEENLEKAILSAFNSTGLAVVNVVLVR